MKSNLGPERGDEVVFRTTFAGETLRGTYVRYYMYCHIIDVPTSRGRRRHYACTPHLVRVIPNVRHGRLQT